MVSSGLLLDLPPFDGRGQQASNPRRRILFRRGDIARSTFAENEKGAAV
jgi:hypothetical protein